MQVNGGNHDAKKIIGALQQSNIRYAIVRLFTMSVSCSWMSFPSCHFLSFLSFLVSRSTFSSFQIASGSSVGVQSPSYFPSMV